MKNSLRLVTFLLAFHFITNFTQAQHLDPDGTRNYIIKDQSSNHAGYLDKFLPENMQYWMHAQARLDMYCLSRGSAVALSKEISANSASWKGFKAFMQQTDIVGGMNTGIMNKSWEFDDPAKWKKNWSGDIKVIENLKSAGFTRVTMYMQSVLSKGGLSTFDPTAGGAPLSVRVEDCITYAKYIEENKPNGIDVDYALIDAFPAKAGIQKLDYHGAYYDLVMAFQREGIPFVGIMIDMKSNTVKNNANSLLKDCKWIETTLSDSTGQKVYAGWWAWDKTESKAQSCEFIKKAYLNIKNHTDGEFCSHIAIGGTGENRTKVEDLIPADDINGIFSCAARLNQAFSFWELDGTLNPVNYTDDILGPINKTEIPSSEFKSFELEINSINQLTLTWSDVFREDTFKIKRFDDVLDKTDTLTVGYTLKDVTTFVDNSIKPDSSYIYFISAENEHGRTFSEEIQVTITTYAPAEPTHVSTDTSNCYQVEIKWNDNADNEAKHLVIRKKTGVENDSVITTIDANVTSYVDKTIIPAVAYKYKIGAANHVDTTYSNWKEALNTNCASAPKKPENLKAESIFCILDSITRMEFIWIDSSFNETQFELQLQIEGGTWMSHKIGRDTISFVLTLDYDTNYTARLRALNSIDTSSWTAELDFETSCECNRGTYGNFGELWQVGDTIQAEYFDYCQSGLYGQNITYYEPTPDSWAGDNSIRPNDKIDLFRNPTSAGDTIIRIGATGQGEYVEYSIEIKQKDTLFIVSRVANKGDNNVSINYYLDEELVTTLTYVGRTDWKDYHIEFSEFFSPEPGEYTLRVESATGGTDTDWLLISNDRETSAKYRTLSSGINVYPNPVNDYIHVELKNNARSNIVIYSIEGKKLYHSASDSYNKQIDISNFKQGIYIVEISDGTSIFREKIIKK